MLASMIRAALSQRLLVLVVSLSMAGTPVLGLINGWMTRGFVTPPSEPYNVAPPDERPVIIAGCLLAGPLVCGTSQAVNDWYDREVDAINEPDRPIPSGRIPGRWGLYLSFMWTAASLLLASQLGVWVFGAAALGLVLAWMYSMPPFRLKQNGWLGNGACAITYEGFAWFTGAAVMLGGLPPSAERIVIDSHTDGTNAVEDNGPVAMVAMARWYARRANRIGGAKAGFKLPATSGRTVLFVSTVDGLAARQFQTDACLQQARHAKNTALHRPQLVRESQFRPLVVGA